MREGGGQGELGVERGCMERVGGFTDERPSLSLVLGFACVNPVSLISTCSMEKLHIFNPNTETSLQTSYY